MALSFDEVAQQAENSANRLFFAGQAFQAPNGDGLASGTVLSAS